MQKLFSRGERFNWVVGVEEIAGFNKHISAAIKGSRSVNLYWHPFYDFNYDYSINCSGSTISARIKRLFLAPALLGYLAIYAEGFIYVGSARFLNSRLDEGDYEFSFLRARSKKIVFYFLGTDIRSPQKSIDFFNKKALEVAANYLYLTAPHLMSIEYETRLKLRAKNAERYSDLIFTASVDQVSYFTNATQPLRYFYPDHEFHKDPSKFIKEQKTRIVHAPSSPILKGTQLVRSAITRLINEGYQFEYVELHKSTNAKVLRELREAHIVLNEFYSYVPGVFGVEAMANYCALVTAADENIEPDLPRGSNKAWFVTRSYEVYDHLKLLLENRHLQREYAEEGFIWATVHASCSESGRQLNQVLRAIK